MTDIIKKIPMPTWAWVLLGFFSLYLTICLIVFQDTPLSGDGYSSLLQAKIFAQGRLSVEAADPEVREAFVLDHVLDDGRVRSKYPPGWPLLLTPGQWFGNSCWVNPLLGALTILLLMSIAEMFTKQRAAKLGALLVGLSPFMVFNAASYMSHVSSLFCQTLAVWLFFRGCLQAGRLDFLLAGIACGFAFAVRPLDGAICLAALCLSFQKALLRRQAFFVAGALVMIVACVGYSYHQFGDAVGFGYAAYSPTMAKLYGTTSPEISWSHIVEVAKHAGWFGALMLWLPTFCIIPLGAWWFAKQNTPVAKGMLVFGLAFIGLWVLAAQFIIPVQGDAHGPRYIFALVLPTAIFSGVALMLITDAMGAGARTPLLLTLLVFLAVFLVFAVDWGTRVNREVSRRFRVYDLVEKGNIEHAIVFIRNPDFLSASLFARNGIDYGKQNVLYLRDVSDSVTQSVRRAFPGRGCYRYERTKKRIKELVPCDAVE